MPTNAGDIT